jgi:AraC-like DNA-binding protein
MEYIYKGEGYVQVDDVHFRASAGDIYILPIGKNHYYYSDEKNPWEKIWFNVLGSFVGNTLSAYGLEHIYHIRGLDLGDEFETFVERARTCMDEKGIQEAFSECAALFLKIVQRISTAPALQEKIEEPNNVERLKMKIDSLTEFHQTFEDLLEEFFYTKSYMIRVFKVTYGITPYNYLLEHKMKTAKMLLKNTAMSISELAQYLGFANAHYFSNFFSKRAGISPKEYRMSLVTSRRKE